MESIIATNALATPKAPKASKEKAAAVDQALRAPDCLDRRAGSHAQLAPVLRAERPN